MVFVNEIAEVVHRVVDYYSGAPNKNIGDAFLLVWKFEDQDVNIDEFTQIPSVNKENPRVSALAELAVFSFLKMPAALCKSLKLRKYRNNQGLMERLNVPVFNVKMGFGMHVGWAIEGAIGSKYKIDASYLSPNVNIASTLEASTKVYGVNNLISEKVRELVREPLKGMLRTVDKVMIRGSSQPLHLCTVDFHIPEHFYSAHNIIEEKTGIEKKREKLKLKKERKQLREQMEEGKLDIRTLIQTDDDIMHMRINYSNEFHRDWNTAINNYIRGEWEAARIDMEKTLTMARRNALKNSDLIPEDGPSKAILSFMAESRFTAPEDWRKYRDLPEK